MNKAQATQQQPEEYDGYWDACQLGD